MATTRNADRVRAHTRRKITERIDQETVNRVRYYAPLNDPEITRRIKTLDEEWDVERYLEVFASSMALSTLALGVWHSRKWLFVTGIVLPFLLQHGIQGWCPPMALFRRMGIRTRKEIDEENYALKALRGDFDGSSSKYDADQSLRANRAMQAVRT